MEHSALTLNGFLATLPDTVARPVFETDGGRTVLGGGGIVPDILVMADTLTTPEREAIQELDRSGGSFPTSVFNFAVLYLQENPNPGRNLSLTQGDLNRFRGILQESDVRLSDRAFQRLDRFIRFQLEREIALQANGEAGEFLEMLPADRVLQRALTLLRETNTTGDLLDRAAEADLSDWTAIAMEERVVAEAAQSPTGEDPPQEKP
jgi:carboxyl-terminal processing protease